MIATCRFGKRAPGARAAVSAGMRAKQAYLMHQCDRFLVAHGVAGEGKKKREYPLENAWK